MSIPRRGADRSHRAPGSPQSTIPPALRPVLPVALALLMGPIAPACSAQDGAPLVVSSDPELARLASDLLPELARRSGMELREPVRVELRSRDDLVRYLEHKLEEELPPERARAIVDSYALLGLVPSDFDLRSVLMALYTEQVAGFYEPDSTALFVMDDQDDAAIRGLLLHELVHAVQDQSVDLDAITDSELGADRAAAAQSAIEGHATLVMFELMAEEQTGMSIDLSKLPEFGAMLRQSLAGASSQFAALASAPRILQESLIFPYLEGAIYLQRLWVRGERTVPFGENLPLSTEEIVRGGDAPPPVELALAAQGGTLVHDDVLGRLELGVMLEELDVAGRDRLLEAWEGDRYALVERPDGTRSLTSVIAWADAGTADAFAAAMRPALGRLGGPATLVRVEAGSWPATALTIGDARGVTVRVVSAERR